MNKLILAGLVSTLAIAVATDAFAWSASGFRGSASGGGGSWSASGRYGGTPRAAEDPGRGLVRVAVPPLGGADRGRRAVPTGAPPPGAPPTEEAPSITAPPTTAGQLILMALPPQELLQARLQAQRQVRLIGHTRRPITGRRAAITPIQPATSTTLAERMASQVSDWQDELECWLLYISQWSAIGAPRCPMNQSS